MDLLYKEIDALLQIFDIAGRGQALFADLKGAKLRCAARRRIEGRQEAFLRLLVLQPVTLGRCVSRWPEHRLWLHRGRARWRKRHQDETEWPMLGWEGIIASNPDVIVVAGLDRNRCGSLTTSRTTAHLLSAVSPWSLPPDHLNTAPRPCPWTHRPSSAPNNAPARQASSHARSRIAWNRRTGFRPGQGCRC